MQSVGSEDVYLGMGTTDPSSASCDTLVVKIKLPGEKMNELDLDVQRQIIVVQSAKHRLATYLPRPVESSMGNAKWYAEKEELVLRLPLSQED